nr:unnamed protein product [Callosobruchus chinensis]
MVRHHLNCQGSSPFYMYIPSATINVQLLRLRNRLGFLINKIERNSSMCF